MEDKFDMSHIVFGLNNWIIVIFYKHSHSIHFDVKLMLDICRLAGYLIFVYRNEDSSAFRFYFVNMFAKWSITQRCICSGYHDER